MKYTDPFTFPDLTAMSVDPVPTMSSINAARDTSGMQVPHLLLAILLGAAAGGMGWGIRGQYGHETGAMIAGVLVGYTLVLLFLPRATSLRAARAVAMFVAGVSLGGSMTYGQTIGLTQDAALIGNWSALRWGLLGLFIKGGIWIGFAGALLGMGLGDVRYRPREIAVLVIGLLVLMGIGTWLLNRPFDPVTRQLPRVYFSDSWSWSHRPDWKPRPECWGGLLAALLGLIIYLHAVRRDRLARNLAVIGFLAGGIGFAAGQSIQAWHAWQPELFRAGWFGRIEPYVNWWNMMEITFGATFGGFLAAGLWFHRTWIVESGPPDEVELSPAWEAALLTTYGLLVIAAEFSGVAGLELFLEYGLVIVLIPLVGILGGRYGPYLFTLPLVALPIAGKTLREVSYRHGELSVVAGWTWLVLVPLGVAFAAALWLARRGQRGQPSAAYARVGLLLATWLYFGWNSVVFRGPWPWREWTTRTPSGLFFAACTVFLTIAAIGLHRGRGKDTNP